MKSKHRLHEPQPIPGEGCKARTLDLKLRVAEPGLGETLIRSFDIAKSAGRDLDVLFCVEPRTEILAGNRGR